MENHEENSNTSRVGLIGKSPYETPCMASRHMNDSFLIRFNSASESSDSTQLNSSLVKLAQTDQQNGQTSQKAVLDRFLHGQTFVHCHFLKKKNHLMNLRLG